LLEGGEVHGVWKAVDFGDRVRGEAERSGLCNEARAEVAVHVEIGIAREVGKDGKPFGLREKVTVGKDVEEQEQGGGSRDVEADVIAQMDAHGVTSQPSRIFSAADAR
jgi:hypothetical protein